MRAIDITDALGQIIDPQWLARAETVHRQLRPNLPADYASRMAVIFASGARMTVVVQNKAVLCVALWRVIENTYEGRRLYVDDLVSDENRRSQGAGQTLLTALESRAKTLNCDVLALDSGVQRARAHRFYFREAMHIASFCFKKDLK